jgi:hypothetical protein
MNEEINFDIVESIHWEWCIIFINFFKDNAYTAYQKSLDEWILVVYEDETKNLIKLMPQQISSISDIGIYLKKLVRIINNLELFYYEK